MVKAYFVLGVAKHKQFIVGKKLVKGYFFGEELSPAGSQLNTAGKFVLPGGRRETEDKDVVASAVREFEEETGFLIPTDQISNSWTIKLDNKPYQAAYQLIKSRTDLRGIAEVINKNLTVAKVASAAVAKNTFGKDGKAFRKQYPLLSLSDFIEASNKSDYAGFCPHSNELEFVEIWDMKENAAQIEAWRKDEETDWLPEILDKIQWT